MFAVLGSTQVDFKKEGVGSSIQAGSLTASEEYLKIPTLPGVLLKIQKGHD